MSGGESRIEYCDVCGRAFSYPLKGNIEAGFGICNACYEQQRNEEAGEGAYPL